LGVHEFDILVAGFGDGIELGIQRRKAAKGIELERDNGLI
jgi:hypothetical protein